MSKSERKRVAAMERKQKEAQEDGSAPETPEVQPTVEQAAPRFVTLRAADKRMLELSIGELVFKGREIQVPAELEGEARRILEVGGFYLKD